MNSLLDTHERIQVADMPLVCYFLVNRVCAGFPSPAEDLGAKRIDLTQLLVKHAQATYFMRANGLSMMGAGIHDGSAGVKDANRSWGMRQERHPPQYTTKWSDLPVVRA